MTKAEQEPTGIRSFDEEEFQAAKKHLEAKGSDPRALDFLRKWGVLRFGEKGTFFFSKFRRRDWETPEREFYPYLEVSYFGSEAVVSHLSVTHARWGGLSQFELKAFPVTGVSLEEHPTSPKVVFTAPWDEAKVKISEDGSLFLEGHISPPQFEEPA